MHPVDLTNLRSMTDGDAEMEKLLFEEFAKSVEEAMQGMKTHLGAEGAATWRSHAHALKGLALNLGAGKMGDLCKEAQEKCSADPQEKQVMLSSIAAEYRQVDEYLKTVA